MADANQSISKADLIDPTPRRKLFPGEDEDAYRAFRLALLSELAPESYYERQLAENLVDLEWEAVRYRNLRADLVKSETRDQGAQAFENLVSAFSWKPSEHSIAMANGLVVRDGPHSEAAMNALEDAGISFEEIVARAYAKQMPTLRHIEQYLGDIEPRRRRLLDDYNGLKSKRAQNISDAEILETDDD